MHYLGCHCARLEVYFKQDLPSRLRNEECRRLQSCFIETVSMETQAYRSDLWFSRLQAWHKKCNNLELTSEDEKYLLANFVGFCAEIYAKIKVVC